LGEIIKNHISSLEEIQDLIHGHYNRPTTLKRMFNEYNYPSIEFRHSSLEFKREPLELEITSLGGLGDGVFPKNYDQTNIPDIWQPGYDNSYLYPQILNIDFCLKEFYEDPLPADLYTSPRYTHQELAEIYYIQIIKDNGYSLQKIVEFIDNYCKYFHGSQYHYKYYTIQNKLSHTIDWYHEYVDKVYNMIKNQSGNITRSTVEKNLKTIHCKSIYNKIYNETNVMTADLFHDLYALDEHINTNKMFFDILITDENLKNITDATQYHYAFSSEGSTHDFVHNKEYFEKAYELFKEVRNLV
jgi:DNA-binding transcriptional MerR regulator